MELDRLRKHIDKIDAQLLDLLKERMEVVKQVGALKNKEKSVIYRPEREKAIVDRLCRLGTGALNRAAVEAIFQEIFAVSRNIELPERVAFLGPEGSFTHQAAESRFGAMSEYLPIGSIQSVFHTIETGRARFGVVPIENNQEGVVHETILLLANSPLKIVAEIPMPIHLSFASQSDKVEDIKKIYSKDIAFRQCKGFLEDTISKQVELIPVNSTSTAARLAAEDPHAAAICSHIAARTFKLPISFENIEDSADNQTRFLILSQDFINQKSGNDKTTILAKISDKPGALVDFLKDFHAQNINLKKIESIPAKKGKSFAYWFFIDFEGHFSDPEVKDVFDKHKKDIKLLGSYVMLC